MRRPSRCERTDRRQRSAQQGRDHPSAKPEPLDQPAQQGHLRGPGPRGDGLPERALDAPPGRPRAEPDSHQRVRTPAGSNPYGKCGTARTGPSAGSYSQLASPTISAKASGRFAVRHVVWRRDDLFLRLFHDRLGFRLPGTLNPVLPADLPYPLSDVVP